MFNVSVNFFCGENVEIEVSVIVFNFVLKIEENVILIVVYYCISKLFVFRYFFEYCKMEECEDGFIVEKVFKF